MSIFSSIRSLFAPVPAASAISFVVTANRVERDDQIDLVPEIEKFHAGEESAFPTEFLASLPTEATITAMVARKRYRPNARTRIDFWVSDQKHVLTLPDETILALC